MKLRDLETPCYIVNYEEYEKNISQFVGEFEAQWGSNIKFGYSVKTNNFPYMLQRAMAHGFYAEVVSPDELAFAGRCGCGMDRIIYNGPQKRDTLFAACSGRAIVNLDNMEEVDAVCAAFRGSAVSPILGLRVNFDLEAECPGETTCAGIPGRFGICLENGDFEKALAKLRRSGLKLSGLHLHQSSRTRSLKIYASIAAKAVEIGREYALDGLDYIDIGGGFFGGSFFAGKPAFRDYAETVCRTLRGFYDPQKTTLILEPGAAILATSMDYLTSVLNIREIRGHRIVTVDGSVVHINPFMNPHPTPFTMIDPGAESDTEQIIGGSTCMELDRFWPRDMKNLAEHSSKFMFHCCGAYMSTHNSSFINAAPNIYLYKDGGYTLLRKKSIDGLFP
ncbi:MAG: diaminopimelate decarboxylase [Clostridiales bacterium]|nr:diaminopimelate decarboxylase [Clostridiales bacterium]